MIPVTLVLTNKKVVIVGGGKIAKRKAYAYQKEGAKVVVISPTISFDVMDMQWIQDVYKPEYIEDAFLVYTATDDLEINHQVIEDCNRLNIVCGSATYEKEASIHGMSYLENDFGILAVSSLGRLPYQKPLLDALNEVFDVHYERLQLLMDLRPYIIKEEVNKQAWFSKAYACPISWLQFLLDAYQVQKGTLFVFHQSEKQNTLSLPFAHTLVVTLEEYEMYGTIFDLSIIKIVPLVLTKGRIYDRMQAVLPHKKCEKALFEDVSLVEVVNALKKENVENWIVVHPRGTTDLIEQITNETQMVVKTFDDEFVFEKDKEYHLMIWLITHGKHYDSFVDVLSSYTHEGYALTWSEPLMYLPNMMTFIEKKYL